MATLRSTVIMKTDIYEFTPRTRILSEAELSLLLSQQKALVSDVAIKNEGTIVKGEGDSFWLIFPSVTVAALAAVELQQELRALQSGLTDEKRLAIRVVITLGNVLHQDNDIFGEVVNFNKSQIRMCLRGGCFPRRSNLRKTWQIPIEMGVASLAGERGLATT